MLSILPHEIENYIYEFYNPYKEIYNRLLLQEKILNKNDLHFLNKTSKFYYANIWEDYEWREDFFRNLKVERFRKKFRKIVKVSHHHSKKRDLRHHSEDFKHCIFEILGQPLWDISSY